MPLSSAAGVCGLPAVSLGGAGKRGVQKPGGSSPRSDALPDGPCPASSSFALAAWPASLRLARLRALTGFNLMLGWEKSPASDFQRRPGLGLAPAQSQLSTSQQGQGGESFVVSQSVSPLREATRFACRQARRRVRGIDASRLNSIIRSIPELLFVIERFGQHWR